MEIKDLFPLPPWEGPPIPRGLLATNPVSPFKMLEHSWQGFKGTIEAVRGPGTVEEKFTKVADALAPPVPNIDGLPEWRKKVNEKLAPTLLHKYLPPVPRAIVKK